MRKQLARSANVSVRIAPEEKEILENAAIEDERTLSQYIHRVLKVHIEELVKAGRGRKK